MGILFNFIASTHQFQKVLKRILLKTIQGPLRCSRDIEVCMLILISNVTFSSWHLKNTPGDNKQPASLYSIVKLKAVSALTSGEIWRDNLGPISALLSACMQKLFQFISDENSIHCSPNSSSCTSYRTPKQEREHKMSGTKKNTCNNLIYCITLCLETRCMYTNLCGQLY